MAATTMDLCWRRHYAPRLVALDTVVIPIALGDLFLLVLLFALGPSPFRESLVALEYRLLRERRRRGHEVGAIQLEEQEARGERS
jgi:hypothetical protein